MGFVWIVLIAVAGALVFAGVVFGMFFGPSGLGGMMMGSGNVTTQEFSFSDFTTIRVNSGFRFDIVQSNSYRVRVTADSNLFTAIDVSKTGSTLSVGLKPGYSLHSTSLRVEIAMPDLHGLDLNGGATGSATGFASSHEFTVTSSGGASVSVDGRAHDLTIDASGGSRLDLSSFHVDSAKVNMSGGCQTTINIDGRLDADLSGGSGLRYIGNYIAGTISLSGGATISRI